MLLLLHGLGATAAVWDGLRAELDGRGVAARVLAPDLPGHGAAEPLDDYSFEGLAAALAPPVEAALEPGERVTVLGHSLGGVVALVLAAGRLDVARVVGLGIKTAWSEEDLARATGLAARPPRSYASRDEAVDRHLALSGLRGLLSDPHPAVTSGVRPDGDGWGLALDTRAFGVGAPDLPALLAASRAEVLLARGEHDPMVSDADLAVLAAPHRTLPGLGHSAHVEDPAAVAALLSP